MESVLTGVILRRVPLSEEQRGINQTWRATVRTIEGDMDAIAKHIDERELMVECVCALLGRAVGLPIPRPLLLRDDEFGFLFGAEELPHPDLRQVLSSVSASAVVADQLSRWALLPKASAFDGWIVNPDRNQGNILTNGGGDFWLIDHGRALPPGISPDKRELNQLLNLAKIFATDDIKQRKLLNQLGEAVRAMDPTVAAGIAEICPWVSKDVLTYLGDRFPHLLGILREAVTGNHELPGF